MSVVARPVSAETTQLGVEAVGASGVQVVASRLLQSIGFSLDPEVDISVFGPAGQDYDTAAIINREWSSGGLTGTPDYREIAFPLCGVYGNPTIALAGGSAYDWTWNPRSVGGFDRPRTFTLERGVAGMSAEAVTYLTMTALNQNFSREGGMDQGGSFFARRLDWDAQMSTNQKRTITPTGTISGGTFLINFAGTNTAAVAYNATASAIQTALELLANVEPGDVIVTGGPLSAGTPVVIETTGIYAQQAVTITVDGALLTGGGSIAATTSTPFALPTSSDVIPIMPGEVNVYLDTTFGAIGTTQYTGDFACGWGIGDRRNPVWTLNRSLNSFSSTVQTKPNPTFTLSVNNDPTGRQLIPVMRAGTSRFVRIECIGPVIGGGYSFEYVIDLHGKIVQAPGQGDVNGARSLDWTFRTMHSSAWGQAQRIRLRTDLSALA